MSLSKDTLKNIHTFLTKKATFSITGEESKALTVAIVQVEQELLTPDQPTPQIQEDKKPDEKK